MENNLNINSNDISKNKSKLNFKNLFICILIPLAIGAISGFISSNNMNDFKVLNKPTFSPPGWLFPVVWTILYILMGIASYLIINTKNSSHNQKNSAITLYGIQLLFNFFWTFWFFNLKLYLFAFIWLIALWFLILVTTVKFFHISKTAAYLMIPYLIWVTFAGYLNLGITLLN